MPGDGNGINYVKEAFKWQYNLIALAGAAAFAWMSGNELPLVLAGGLELMYLAAVPQMERFQRLIRSRKYEEEKRAHDQALFRLQQSLPPEIRDRHWKLIQICNVISANYKRFSSTSQIFLEQLENQLQELLASYVRLSHAALQTRDYLQQTNQDSIRREIDGLKKALPKETPKVQEINSKRIEILEKRFEKYDKIKENRQVIDAQCEAVADVLELIRDQSITMSDPQQLSDRLESLVKDVQTTEESVREVESIFQMSPAADGFPGNSYTPSRDRTRS